MELVSTLEACQILIGGKHFRLFKRMFGQLEGAPKVVTKRGWGHTNMYRRDEIIVFGKDRDVLAELRTAFNAYIYEYQQRKKGRRTETPVVNDSLEVRFLRGDFSPQYKQIVKKHVVRMARDNQAETIRVSVSEEEAA
ncbi:hypothetical protein V2P20_09240 [Methylobacter sp. Wu1]|uniref:hypothetical protein n=1 Tax=Methylobacter sp. Wu1 TaxID=3119359 RepID=UPI002F925EA1